jgi:dockerin type I repeat protein
MKIFTFIRRQMVALVVLCCFVFFGSQPAPGQTPKFDPASNNPPPVGAILDLNGTPVPGGGNNTYQQYSVNFTASITNTAITIAFREDPAFISFSKASVTDVTTPSGELLVNGDFSQGTYNNNNNPLTPIGWTFANEFGAAASGRVLSGCGVGATGAYGVGNCWFDGAVLAYDAISQTITTIVGHTYHISFWVADDSGCNCNFSDLSGPGVNGINVTVYAQAGLPTRAGTTSGALLTINGTVNSGTSSMPVNVTLSDKDIHSGSFHTVMPGTGEDNCTVLDEISSDANVLQAGAPTGCDPGDPFEGSLTDGHASLTAPQGSAVSYNFGVTTHYQCVLIGGACSTLPADARINTKRTITSGDTGFMTVFGSSLSSFTGTITLAAKSPVCGSVSDSFTGTLPADPAANVVFALAQDSSGCGGFTSSQVQTATVTTDGTTATTAVFNNNANQLVQHDLIFPSSVTFPISNPQLQVTNILISNSTGWPPYVIGTPFATSKLFVHDGDNATGGGSDIGSMYEDQCFNSSNAPSEPNCPIPNPGSQITSRDTFDISNKPPIPLGTTVAFIHYYPNTIPSITTWSPSSTSPNPVCTNVTSSSPGFACDLMDILVNLSGDQTSILGRDGRKGTFAGAHNVPMALSTVSVNGTQVNTPGAQTNQSSTLWFMSPLRLNFVVNPACPPGSPTCPPAPSASNNFYTPAPVAGETYDVTNLTGGSVVGTTQAQPTPSTLSAQQVTFPGANNQVALADGQYFLQFGAVDTVGIKEQNIQFIPGTPPMCPDGSPVAAGGFCYSTSPFQAQLNVDTTKPMVTGLTLSTTMPTPGQIVTANYMCNDQFKNNVASGIASCGTHTGLGGVLNTGTLNNTFPAAAVKGPQSYSVTATDVAGNNSDPTSANYTVVVPDANGDGVVNCLDMAIVKASFGKRITQAGFDPRADVNGDGVVNVLDLAIVARNIPAGTKCP